MPRRRPVALLAAAAALVACASEPLREERRVLLGNENRTFLILPLNVAAPMPAELEGLSPVVWKELERYLRAQGKELKTVNRQVARTLWIDAIREARAGEKGARAGYDDAARNLAVELARHAEFDALLAPSLFVREAKIQTRSAVWDGVEREIEFEALGMEARSALTNMPLEGAAPAVSLHLAAFDRAGDKLHEGTGGLELLTFVRVTVHNPSGQPDAINILPTVENPGTQRPRTPHFEFVGRTDLFTDRARLIEGFNVAFVPFLPPLRD